MERLHLLEPGNCFVEFGAGRGKLSHWVDIALQDSKDVHFLLVERATTRFKVRQYYKPYNPPPKGSQLKGFLFLVGFFYKKISLSIKK